MRITLTVTAGARTGVSKHFDQAYIGLGRHPQSDLQLHPEKDIDVSTRHAAILKSGETWVLRDLGSANGTFVNGEKLTADRRLHTGDQVSLGAKGAVFTVEVEGEAAPPAAATRLSGSTPGVKGGSTT
ncbi:MAG TPA: FHA domain-containing protein, partial [Gemmatimonadales bacterium]|nr:FHA domain-containing protein [Gemmatimonadales bacterium]